MQKATPQTSVYSFGSGSSGQLGSGETKDNQTPQYVQYFSTIKKNVKFIACGSYNTAFITTDNELYLCGLVRSPKDGSTMFESIAQGGGDLNPQPRKIDLPTDVGEVVRVSVGNYHILALTDSGSILAWGSNSHGQLGVGPLDKHVLSPRPIELKCVRQIDAGIKHSAAVNEWGELYMWGNNEHGQLGLGDITNRKQPTRVTKLKREFVLGVACGDAHTVCYTSSGKVYSWGQCSTSGKVTTVPVVVTFDFGTPVRQLACGAWMTAALTETGELYTWELGQPPVLVPGMQQFSVRQIAAGNFHVVCATDEGYVVTFGRNSSGQLGRTSDPAKAAVVSIPGLTSPVVAVSAGEFHTCVLSSHSEKARITLVLLRLERSFYRKMLLLNKIYYNTLQASASDKAAQVTEPTRRLSLSMTRPTRGSKNLSLSSSGGDEEYVISTDELSEIFSNVDEIVLATQNLVTKLDTFIDEYLHSQDETVGKVFLDESILASFRTYIPFSDNYNGACMCLFNCRRISSKLVEILKDCDTRARTTGIHLPEDQTKDYDLKAMLLLALQNVPRIVFLLKELEPLTATSQPLLLTAKVKLSALLDRLNQNFQFVDPLDLLNCTPNEFGYPEMMGGSIPQLVDRLTHHNIYDPHFRDVFLLTYRAFATPVELLNLLIKRFNEEEGQPTSQATRIRILQVLTSWIVNHRYDFDAEPSTSTSYTTSSSVPSRSLGSSLNLGPSLASALSSSLNITPSGSSLKLGSSLNIGPSLSSSLHITPSSSSGSFLSLSSSSSFGPPPTTFRHPLLDFLARAERIEGLQTSCKQLKEVMQNMSRTSVTTGLDNSSSPRGVPLPLATGTCALNGMIGQISADDLAKQLALLDHAYLVNIDARQFLELAWMKGNGPTIQMANDHFNRLTCLIASEILSTKSTNKRKKARAHLISHFIDTAELCMEYNDLSALSAIIYTLSSSSISRLKKTWEKVSKDSTAKFERLSEIVSPSRNYVKQRAMVATMQPPCVPFLGILLKDLLFIEEGNPAEISGLINFYKHRKVAEKVFLILQYQHTRYQFPAIMPVREYILSAQVLDEKAQTKLSSSLE